MQPKEPLDIRKEMVAMHDEYISRLQSAMEQDNYVEAVWFCYAIFEQRVNRLIDKILCKCPKDIKKKNNPVSISVRISCLRQLIDLQYGGFAKLDKALFSDILLWCEDRNELVHGLVHLSHYRQFDYEFEELAKRGEPLALKLYKESAKFRKWFMDTDVLPEFPYKGCKNKQKCIKEA